MSAQNRWPGEVIHDDVQQYAHEAANDTAPAADAVPASAAAPAAQEGFPGEVVDPAAAPQGDLPYDPLGQGDIGFAAGDNMVRSLPPGNDEYTHDITHGIMTGQITSADQLIQIAAKYGVDPKSWEPERIKAVNDAIAAVHNGVPLSSVGGLEYAAPDVEEIRKKDVLPETADAFARAAVPFGLGDELGAAVDTVRDGGSYSENLHKNRAVRDYDEEEHYYARLGGEIVGSLTLPTGVQGVAKTAIVDTLKATMAEELARGVPLLEAKATAKIAARAAGRRAATQRLAAEGGGYGAAYGAGSSDGNIGDRGIAAAASGISGAVLGTAIPAAVGGLQRGSNALGTVVRPVLDSITTAGARNRAAGVLESNALRPIGEILRDIRTRPEPVEGVKPTLAEVAGDVGLAGLQRGVANSSGVENAAIAERGAQNALARTRAASEVMGDGSPQAVQDLSQKTLAEAERATAEQQAARSAELDARYASDRDIAGRRTAQAHGALSRAGDALGDVSDREASGAHAREAFSNAYETAKARSREAYSAPALQEPHPIDLPVSLANQVREAANNFYGDGGGTMPETLRAVIGDMFEQGATTRTLTNIDRRLADFAGEARMAGRNSEAAFAERIRHDLGATANKVAPKEYRDALANAKAIRAEQGRVYESGAAAPAFARDRYGNAKVGNTEIPGRLVRPGAPGGSSIDSLVAAIGPERAERVAREEMRRVVEEAGVQTEAQARRVAVRYGEAAKRFPAVAQDLEELQAHARALDAARHAEAIAGRASPTAGEKAAAQELSALHSEILASPMANLADSAREPSAFIGGLLRRSDKGRMIKGLWNRIGDNEEAQQGFRRALGDFIESAGEGPNVTAAGEAIPSINKTRRAIALVLGNAGETLTREQKITLGRVSRELEGANFAATAGKPAGSDTALNASYAGLVGKIPFAGKTLSVLQTVIKAMGNQNEVNRLIREAILDPDFAATLLKRTTNAHLGQVRARLILARPAVTFAPSAGDRISSSFSGSAPARLAADEASDSPLGVPEGNSQNSQDYPGEELP